MRCVWLWFFSVWVNMGFFFISLFFFFDTFSPFPIPSFLWRSMGADMAVVRGVGRRQMQKSWIGSTSSLLFSSSHSSPSWESILTPFFPAFFLSCSVAFRDTSQSVFTAFLVVYVLSSFSRDAASVVVNARSESSQILACVVFFQSVIRLRMSGG